MFRAFKARTVKVTHVSLDGVITLGTSLALCVFAFLGGSIMATATCAPAVKVP